MKRAIIVHCWGGVPQYCWYPWAKNELEARGFTVEVPAMPETDLPKQKLWVPALAKLIGEPNEELFLVGHSIGCAAIMRYLEQLPADKKVGGVVFVAGFTDALGIDEIANFFATPLDLAKIRPKSVHGFMNIHSDNDPYVPVIHSTNLKTGLGGEAIVLHGKGHFSGPIDNEASCTELPEVISAITRLTQAA
jgi:predicted alpha/beta hydrolase family esterase